MERWARELAENGNSILYVDRISLSVFGVGRLHAFGGVSRQGTTLLGLGQSRRALPDISGGIVLPFIETVGHHSIFTDGCPMYQGLRVREIIEQNGLAQFSVPSTFGPMPIEQIWSLLTTPTCLSTSNHRPDERRAGGVLGTTLSAYYIDDIGNRSIILTLIL